MGHTACTEPQCMYKGDVYIYLFFKFLSASKVEFWVSTLRQSGPGSVVGISTGYGLDGPGIESRWGGRDFPQLGPTQPPVQWVPGLSRG